MSDMGGTRSISVLVGIARNEIDHGYRHDGIEPEEYVGQCIHLIESGDLTEHADDWARQQNEYVYTTIHFDMEADYRHTDEWHEAERGAAKAVAMRLDQRLHPLAPDAGDRLIKMRDMLRAETVAVFLTDVYTTAVWDWLELVRVESATADAYLDEQAELALANVRDVPYLD